jgi:hypothetical protein
MKYERQTYLDIWKLLDGIAYDDGDGTLPDDESTDVITGDCYLAIEDEEAALESKLITKRDFENGCKFSTVYKRYLKLKLGTGSTELIFQVPINKVEAVKNAVKAIITAKP